MANTHSNQGDTLDITLDYTINGEPITEGLCDEIEVSIGNKQYTLTHNDIVWDNELEKYTLFVGQADTFALGKITEYQVRFKLGTKVVSVPIRKLIIGGSISTKVI